MKTSLHSKFRVLHFPEFSQLYQTEDKCAVYSSHQRSYSSITEIERELYTCGKREMRVGSLAWAYSLAVRLPISPASDVLELQRDGVTNKDEKSNESLRRLGFSREKSKFSPAILSRKPNACKKKGDSLLRYGTQLFW